MFKQSDCIEKLTDEKLEKYNQEPDACWECYSCVKIIPQSSIAVRGYDDFVPIGRQIQPRRIPDAIMWTVKFRNGACKKFKFPIKGR